MWDYWWSLSHLVWMFKGFTAEILMPDYGVLPQTPQMMLFYDEKRKIGFRWMDLVTSSSNYRRYWVSWLKWFQAQRGQPFHRNTAPGIHASLAGRWRKWAMEKLSDLQMQGKRPSWDTNPKERPSSKLLYNVAFGKSFLLLLLDVWSWASTLVPWSLHFLICELGRAPIDVARQCMRTIWHRMWNIQ